MDNEKEHTVNYLLDNFMNILISVSLDPKTSTRYAISACLRFASRAAINLNIPVGEILRELQEEWMWNEKDIHETGISN
jgi:hypothetical protein